LTILLSPSDPSVSLSPLPSQEVLWAPSDRSAAAAWQTRKAFLQCLGGTQCRTFVLQGQNTAAGWYGL